MPATRRGPGWELLQSWWVLLTFPLGLLAGPAFLYAGRRTRTRRWVWAGFFYSLVWVPFGLLPTPPKPAAAGGDSPWLTSPIPYGSRGGDVLVLLLLCFWLASVIHAFRARREYLIRLDAVQSRDPYADLRRELAAEREAAAVPAPPPGAFAAPPAPEAAPPAPGPPVDLNRAPAEALAALPGVGPLLARRAEQERRVRGGFRSLEEFGEALGLKPHALERLRALTTIGPPPPPDAPDAPPSAGGRVVDF